jgi:large subunit ribosomal protein L35
MPKMKTHKGTRKRVSLTGTGKVKRTKAMHQKYAIKKTGSQLQKLRQSATASSADEKRIKRMLSS